MNPPGSILAEKYIIERVIGQGGMGIILAAKHIQLGQQVAIKVLNADASADIDMMQRFLREAKAIALIKSEHVVRVLDFGTALTGEPFLVMEHLEGSDLDVTLETRGRLTIADAVEYVLQACEGVAEAHHLGIIHRDLKPANLFLTLKKDGSPAIKVLDFGASKLMTACKLAASDPSTTHGSTIIGSPRYMAPEQLTAGQEIDARVDVYALGAALYELLAGKAAFLADSIELTLTKVLREMPVPLRDVRPDVPQELETAILRALAKDRGDRFSSVKELAAALAPFAPERAKSVIAQIERTGDSPPISLTVPSPIIQRHERTIVKRRADKVGVETLDGSRLVQLNRTRRIRWWGMGGASIFLAAATAILLARFLGHDGRSASSAQAAQLVPTTASPAPTETAVTPRLAETIDSPAPPSSYEARPAAHPPDAVPHAKKSPQPSGPYSQFGDRQ